MSQTPTDVAELEVEVEHLPSSQANLTVTAPASEVDRAIVRALSQLSRQVRLPGFRPGKAPASVVERAVGWEAVRQEAIDLLLPELYQRAVRQEQLEPVSQPNVAEVELDRGQPFHFVASVVLRPEVKLGDYGEIRVPLETKEVPEADIDGTVDALRQRYAQLTDVGERGIEASDVVTAELSMIHNGEPVGTPGQVQVLDLQRGELLPGMAEQLLGATAGAEPVEITVTLPEDYAREELRGEMVTVTTKVTRIQLKELPALDDNLAAIAGHGETLEELRGYIQEQIATEMAEQARKEQAGKVMDALLELAKTDVPEPMIQAEIDHQLRDLERRLAESGVSLDTLLAVEGQSLEQLRGERRQSAAERVRLELALGQIANQEGFQPADEEVSAALTRLLPKGSSKDVRERAREPIRREMAISMARDHLLSLATEAGEQPTV
jgi:trigger factor